MKTLELSFENDSLADIAALIIEDALGNYESPRHVISGITKGIDYELIKR